MQSSGRISDEVLKLLREWRWEQGIALLREKLPTLDEKDRPIAQSLLGWLAAERGDYADADRDFDALTDHPTLAGWALVGQSFIASRQRQVTRALSLLTQAERYAGDDRILLGAVRLVQGSTRFHAGETDGVLESLEAAADAFAPNEFSLGRALDALGMWYAHHDDVLSAVEFYDRALRHKESVDDEAGLATTHGQLGRLYLDWARLDLAEHHFRADLDICRRIDDRRGEAQMYNYLGLVALHRNDLDSAAAYLDHAITHSQEGCWSIMRGYALKDRAWCWLLQCKPELAAELLDQTDGLFGDFTEGRMHAQRVRGMLHRLCRQWNDADRCLRQARRFFEDAAESAEVARVRLEQALVQRDRGAPLPLVRDELLGAITAAESARRPALVQQADQALAQIDPIAHARRVYQRVRGRRIDEDSTSLVTAEQKIVTVMFFDLQGFTAWSRHTDPGVVLLSLNQIMAKFQIVLAEHDVQVIEYMGDGFLALAHGSKHVRRVARSALGLLRTLSDLNRPRRRLQLPEFTGRIGIATGEVVLGNIGGYDKIDYRAVGPTVNRAARLQAEALPVGPAEAGTPTGSPALDRAAWESIQHEFRCRPNCPRTVDLKGLGPTPIWDLLPP